MTSQVGFHQFPGDTSLLDLVVTPDGADALVVVRVGVVDCWNVIVHHWPESSALAAMLVGVVAIWRVWHRPQQAGGSYCRRCNYLLLDPGARCPECASVRPPVAGRRRRGRLALAGVAMATVVTAYVVGARHAPRAGVVADWMSWPSTRCYDWAYHSDLDFLTRHKTWRYGVNRIDLETGRVRFTPVRSAADPLLEIKWGADAETFWLRGPYVISRHRTTDGRELARYEILPADRDELFLRSFAPIGDGPSVLAVATLGHLLRFDGPSYEPQRVADVTRLVSTGRSWRLRVLPDGSGALFEQWPPRTNQVTLSVLDSDGVAGEEVILPYEDDFWLGDIMPSSDSVIAMVPGPARVGVMILESGDPHWIAVPTGKRLQTASADPTGRRLIVTTNDPCILVLDLEDEPGWTPRIFSPDIALWQTAVINDAAKRVVAIGADKRDGNISTLVVFDLPDKP